jgi:acyl dehydratase
MTSGRTRTFASAPPALPLYARAILPALPLVRSLPGVRHEGSDAPDLTLVREGVRTDPNHLADYAALCAFRLTDTLPVTYPHIAAFGLQLALITDAAFPFAPMGTVHVANTITAHRPLHTKETYDVRVHATHLRSHAKGRLIDLISVASVAGDPVWEETTTLLGRGSGRPDATDDLPLRDAMAPEGPSRWRVAADVGRRYAAVSGDRNPIHLYGLTARAFGFPRQIAHGMWTKARCLAALQGRIPDALVVQVAFRRPVLLPTTVAFGSAADDAGAVAFGLRSARDGTAHLVGTVTPL